MKSSKIPYQIFGDFDGFNFEINPMPFFLPPTLSLHHINRNSRQSCSIKKYVLKNSQENTCNGVSFLIKTSSLQLYLREIHHRCFPMNFAKFFKTPFLYKDIFGWLHLYKNKLIRLWQHEKILVNILSVIHNCCLVCIIKFATENYGFSFDAAKT